MSKILARVPRCYHHNLASATTLAPRRRAAVRTLSAHGFGEHTRVRFLHIEGQLGRLRELAHANRAFVSGQIVRAAEAVQEEKKLSQMHQAVHRPACPTLRSQQQSM